MIRLTDRDYAHTYFDDIDLEAQLFAIRAAIHRNKVAEQVQDAELKALANRAKELDEDRDLAGYWVDEMHFSVYHDAARSAATVGMLAPLVENLFVGVFRGIGRRLPSPTGYRSANATSSKQKANLWEASSYFNGQSWTGNLPKGIIQLSHDTGLSKHLPEDFELIIEALFRYRNKMLHEGFEWSRYERVKFGEDALHWPGAWFNSATVSGAPWVWYMSPIFVERVVAFVGEVLDGAGKYARLHDD